LPGGRQSEIKKAERSSVPDAVSLGLSSAISGKSRTILAVAVLNSVKFNGKTHHQHQEQACMLRFGGERSGTAEILR
jgi:hypothetical protein